jgi:hypothetical protein
VTSRNVRTKHLGVYERTLTTTGLALPDGSSLIRQEHRLLWKRAKAKGS